jgi:hypothetical protein
VLTDADIFGYQQDVWSRPDTKGYNEMIDMTGVSQIEFNSADRVSDLAKLSGSMDWPDSPSKLAILATSDEHFGLGRMYATYRQLDKKSKKVVGVFRIRQEALQWLGISVETP